MTKKNGLVFGLLALLLTSCEEAPETGGENHAERTHRACTPSFREISEEPIKLEATTLSIVFSVALIGCNESLLTLTQTELQTITNDFNKPSDLSGFNLFLESRKPSFREKATARVNFLVERQVVTDVLVHGLSLYDYGPVSNDQ